MKILVKQIKDPFCFWGVKVEESVNSQYSILQNAIDSYYKTHGSVNFSIKAPIAGMKCVIKLDNGCWKRAIIKSILSTTDELLVDCIIVDEGIAITVSKTRVFPSFKWVWKVPCQVMKFGLLGVTPCRLKANFITEEATLCPSNHWDVSATMFFEQKLAEVDYLADVEVIRKSPSDELNWVKMRPCNCSVDMSELLIGEKYCFKTSKTEKQVAGANDVRDRRCGLLKLKGTIPQKDSKSLLEDLCQPVTTCYVDPVTVDPRIFSMDDSSELDLRQIHDARSDDESDGDELFDDDTKSEDSVISDKNTREAEQETRSAQQQAPRRRVSSDCDHESDCIQHFQNMCLIEGTAIPTSYSIFCQTPFTDDVIMAMEAMKLRRPTNIQGNCWPAIWKGRDVITIAETGTGKTLCYALPLVNILYKRSHRGADMNPLPSSLQANKMVNTAVTVRAVILCSSKRNIQDVAGLFRKLLRFKNLRNLMTAVLTVTNRDDVNDDLAVNLLNECKVLICSPCSFLEICKQDLLPLFKLQHLVFDDADILMEDFTTEVKEIMTLTFRSLQDVDLPKADRKRPQILLFGNITTEGIKSFKQFCMNKDTLSYIHDPMQAIIYKPVKHDVVICGVDGKYQTLIDLVSDAFKSAQGHIAVFVNSSATAVKVSTALTSICLVEVHELNENYQPSIELIDESPSVLIVTDDDVNLLHGYPIEHGIHFEYPDTSVNQLGLRTSMICNKFKNATSYILFTQSDEDKAAEICQLFNRMSQPIPPSFSQMFFTSTAKHSAVPSSTSSGSEKRLCAYKLSFGFCRNRTKCPLRHEVDPDIDLPNTNKKYTKIPLSGHIKVKITNVKHATYYHARLLKHVDGDRNKSDISGEYEELRKKLDIYFKDNKELVGSPQRGDIVGVTISGHLHRAVVFGPQVKDKPEWYKSSSHSICKFNVGLVDSGERYVMYRNAMYQLNDEDLRNYPYQAIEVRALGVKPADKNVEWDIKANELIHSKIYDKELEGNIKFVIGHTMWLEPCVSRSKVYKANIYVTDCNVAKELFSNRFAVNNDSVSQWLSKLNPNNKAIRDEPTITESSESSSIDNAHLVALLNNAQSSTNHQPATAVRIKDEQLVNKSEEKEEVAAASPRAAKKKEGVVESSTPKGEVAKSVVESSFRARLTSECPSSIHQEDDGVVACTINTTSHCTVVDEQQSDDVVSYVDSTVVEKSSVWSDDTNVNTTVVIPMPPLSNDTEADDGYAGDADDEDEMSIGDENKENIRPLRITNIKFIPRNDAAVKPIEMLLSEKLGVLFPVCAQLSHTSRSDERLELCRKIYIYCASLFYDVSARDILALYSVVFELKTDHERRIVIGSFLRLAYFNLPLWDHISTPHIIGNLLSYHSSSSELPPSPKLVFVTLNFVHSFLKNCSDYKVYKIQLADIAEMLIEFVKYFAARHPPSKHSSKESKNILLLSWQLVNDIAKISKSLLKLGREHGLEELVEDAFEHYRSEDYSSILGSISDQLIADDKERQELERMKVIPKRSAHDVFGYERFDHLDTSDSDVDSNASFHFDYQTIPTDYDAMNGKDTDVEDLVEGMEEEIQEEL